MSKMAELEYEQRMAADQPRPTLREAAQAMITAWEDGEHIHKHFFRDLRDALAEPDEVLAEREACAKVCDENAKYWASCPDRRAAEGSRICGEEIRARGNT